MTSLKDAFCSFVHTGCTDQFWCRLMIYMINNRVQEFADPLTSTLVLMVTSPLQLVFCESGFILFKTTLLPVLPYHLFSAAEKELFQSWVCGVTDSHESCDASGQFSLSLPLSPKAPAVHLCKRQILASFIEVMLHHNGTFKDPTVCCTLCNIILQRFLAIVPVPSDTVTSIMAILQPSVLVPPSALCPLLSQPTDARYKTLPVDKEGPETAPCKRKHAPTNRPACKSKKKAT
jgi:hypothetical protein